MSKANLVTVKVTQILNIMVQQGKHFDEEQVINAIKRAIYNNREDWAYNGDLQAMVDPIIPDSVDVDIRSAFEMNNLLNDGVDIYDCHLERVGPVHLNFQQACEAMLAGKALTRRSWLHRRTLRLNDKREYVFDDGEVFKPTYVDQFLGKDWHIVEEA